jgi:shikimate dehydrogenase
MSDDKQIILGVAGSPVFHSKSPNIFRSIFRERGIDASYMRIAVQWADEAVRICRDLNLAGMNVTAPFKNSIISHLDAVSEDADKMRSVNTVVNREGKLTGYNTDHYGVTSPLEKRLGSLKGKNAVIAGAGGAGVSAAFGLSRAGCFVTVLNITINEAKNIADKFGCGYDLLSNIKKYISDADIFISTLPYEAEPLDISSMKSGSVLMDASYKKSHYKDAAERHGLDFISGEEWLIYQAIHACGHFLDFTPDVKTAYEGIALPRNRRDIISLIGFMGSGKTSVGKELARLSRMEFIDIDEQIEIKMSKTINEIFSTMGEEKFRDIESDMLHSFQDKKNVILSCGGGIVLKEANRGFLRNETECIWLYCGMDSMIGRVTDGTRPLINAMKSPMEAVNLFNSRKNYYALSCESIVLTEKTPEKTAELINEEIRLSF